MLGGDFAPQALGRGGRGVSNPRQEAANIRRHNMGQSPNAAAAKYSPLR